MLTGTPSPEGYNQFSTGWKVAIGPKDPMTAPSEESPFAERKREAKINRMKERSDAIFEECAGARKVEKRKKMKFAEPRSGFKN